MAPKGAMRCLSIMEWDNSDVLVHDPMEENIWAGNVEVIVADWWTRKCYG